MGRFALLAPLVFAAHVLEEAPGFVAWFADLVPPGLSPSEFAAANAIAGLVTVVLALAVFAVPRALPATLLVAWLAFLMAANAVFHLAATLVYRRYCPGVITASALYLPYFGGFLFLVIRRLRVPGRVVLAAGLLGALPMLVHGYLVVFAGSRLF
ncbi:MAG: HXXEE domain-containing protein [Planctomycetota bacterium]